MVQVSLLITLEKEKQTLPLAFKPVKTQITSVSVCASYFQFYPKEKKQPGTGSSEHSETR